MEEIMKIVPLMMIATVLVATPAVAGDATRFLICRSDGCVDIPSLRFVPRQPGPPGPSVAVPQAPPPPAQPQQDALSREIEADIIQFCDRHPEESFCTKLGVWLRQHPEARR
jgi:hypothetical protein